MSVPGGNSGGTNLNGQVGYEYQWAYSIMDSSRVSTFLISMLLIVYGSFRSLNMEQEAKERLEKERITNSLTGLPAPSSSQGEQSKYSF